MAAIRTNYKIFQNRSFQTWTLIMGIFWHPQLASSCSGFCRTVRPLILRVREKAGCYAWLILIFFPRKHLDWRLMTISLISFAISVTALEILPVEISWFLPLKWPVTMESRSRSLKSGSMWITQPSLQCGIGVIPECWKKPGKQE